MSKPSHCLKIFEFRYQFVLGKHEMSSLQRICLFVATIYASFWFAAPLSTAAPTNDLLMLQLIESFTSVDKKIADIAEKKMRLHLRYLGEDLAARSSHYQQIFAGLLQNIFPSSGNFQLTSLSRGARSTSLIRIVCRKSSCLLQ
jgi:hypothetical protein